MPGSLDLNQAFKDALKAHGTPRVELPRYNSILSELAEYLSGQTASKWTDEDLTRFMTERVASIPPQERGMYANAMGVLQGILSEAVSRGDRLEYPSAMSRTARPASRPRIPGVRAVGSTAGYAVSSGARTPAPVHDAGSETPSGFPQNDSTADARVSEDTGESFRDDSLGLFGAGLGNPEFPNGEPDGNESVFGFSRRRRRLLPDEGEEEVAAPALLSVSTPSPSLVGNEAEDFASLLDGGMYDDEPDEGFRALGPALGVDSGAPITGNVDPSGLGVELPAEEADPYLVLTAIEDEGEDASQVSEPEDQEAIGSGTDEPEEREDDQHTEDAEGWRCPHSYRLLRDESVLVAERYVVPNTMPGADEFTARAEAVQIPPAIQEFLTQHRPQAIAVGGGLVIGLVALFLLPLFGALLLLVSTVAGGLLGHMGLMAHRLESLPPAETSHEVVRRYLCALRLGLYQVARTHLATHIDSTGVEVAELASSEEIGYRFNTLSPAGLRVSWKDRLPLFDRGDGRIAQWSNHHLHPGDVDTEQVLSAGEVSVCVVRGRELDHYAVVPAVRLGGVWYLANGECHLRSSRLEALGRLAVRHSQGNIDTYNMVVECRRQNLTEADMRRAVSEGILSEEQLDLLVQGLKDDA